MKRYISIISGILFFAVLAFADTGEFGVKEAGMGLASTARGNDAGSLLMNPASAGLLRSNCFNASYARLAWGIGGSSIERGLFAYVFRRKELGGAGFFFSLLNQDVSYYSRLGLTIAPEIKLFNRQFSFGLTGMWYQTGYRISEFQGHDYGLDPVFANGRTKNAIGVSAGIQGNIYRELQFGIAGRDLNEPNLALQDTVGYGKRPMEFQAGLSYPVHRYFRPNLDLLWRNETINEKRVMKIRAGAEAKLPAGFYVRAGYDGTGVDAGLTIHSTALFGGLDLDYAFVYPLEKDLADVGAMSHHFGLSVWGLEKFPSQVDLLAENIQTSGKLFPKVKGEIVGALRNIGKARSDGFSVTLAVRDSAGNWTIIYPVKFLDGLPPDSSVTLKWNWKPNDPGKFTLRMTVDDDGQKIPEINGVIKERKEDNNSVERFVEVGFGGNVEITFDTRRARVARLEYLIEEKPLLPVVFFDIGKSDLDAEEISTMQEYARRMKGNPDAKLVVEGYFDPSDGVACTTASQLALQRAEAVRNTIIGYDKAIANRVVVANEIECAQPKYRIDPAKATTSADLIAEENRRAELRIEFPEMKNEIANYYLKKDIVDVPQSVSVGMGIIEILKNNEDAILLVEGGFAPGEDTILGLNRADAFRRFFESVDKTLLPGKIHLVPGWDGPKVTATLSGEGILWSPTLSKPSVIGYENLDPATNGIHIKTTGFENVPVDSSVVSVISTDEEKIRRLHGGAGIPPESVVWDWRDDGGHLLLPAVPVRVQVQLFVAGQGMSFKSEDNEGRLSVRVTDVKRRIRRLLVVQFVFDETEPTSHFLESRLDGLAFDLIGSAKDAQSPGIQFAGHTDIIGTEKYNLDLSERRAKKELSILRLYLAHHLGFKNTPELEKWFADNNVTIGAAGYGQTKPYSLQAISADGVPVVIGDNNTPRGRTINRRVTVEHGIDEKQTPR